MKMLRQFLAQLVRHRTCRLRDFFTIMTRDPEDWRKHYDSGSINGLLLPPLLLHLLSSGRWRTPDELMRSAIPRLREPVDFLGTVEQMAFESQGFLADQEWTSLLFHEYRGSSGVEKPLPWRDVERSIVVAVNRQLGADLGIALDYRSGVEDPSVLASDWWTGDQSCHWFVVSKTFSEFVSLMQL